MEWFYILGLEDNRVRYIYKKRFRLKVCEFHHVVSIRSNAHKYPIRISYVIKSQFFIHRLVVLDEMLRKCVRICRWPLTTLWNHWHQRILSLLSLTLQVYCNVLHPTRNGTTISGRHWSTLFGQQETNHWHSYPNKFSFKHRPIIKLSETCVSIHSWHKPVWVARW